jgi:hypothetical protein
MNSSSSERHGSLRTIRTNQSIIFQNAIDGKLLPVRICWMCKAGETVFVPRGTPHAWCNVGNTPGKLYFGFTTPRPTCLLFLVSHKNKKKGHKLYPRLWHARLLRNDVKGENEGLSDIENLTNYFMKPDAEELKTGWQEGTCCCYLQKEPGISTKVKATAPPPLYVSQRRA